MRKAKYLITLFFLLLGSYLISGCSHTDYVMMEPNYSELEIPNAISAITPKVTFTIGTFEDLRRDTLQIANFKDGVHNYTIYNYRPIGVFFFEGLKKLLDTSGHYYVNTNENDITVNITLKEITIMRNDNALYNNMKSTISIIAEFVDSKTKKQIYKSNYNGEGNAFVHAFTGNSGPASDSFDRAFLDIYNKVGKDDKLAKELKLFNSNKVK
jgi:uncharacterized lipoprotein YajG